MRPISYDLPPVGVCFVRPKRISRARRAKSSSYADTLQKNEMQRKLVIRGADYGHSTALPVSSDIYMPLIVG